MENSFEVPSNSAKPLKLETFQPKSLPDLVFKLNYVEVNLIWLDRLARLKGNAED